MMKRTGYLIVLSLITIVCVVLGSIKHFGGIKLGMPFALFGGGEKIGTIVVKGDDGSVSGNTISLDEFNEMKIDLNVMDLTIETGDEACIHYECNKKNLVPSIDVEDGKLIIKQPKMKNIFNIGRVKCKMTITVPKDKDMKDVVITTDTGDVKIADLTGESLSLDTDTGDIKLNKCDFASSKIDGDTGDMKYESCNLGDCEISNDTGDVSLINSDFAGESGSLNIDNDTGDVRIEGCRDLGLFVTDLSTDIGDIEVNGTNCKKKYSQEAVSSSQSEKNPKIVISTDVGDIRVNQK
ncbi:MAG: DUF4097 domain-containing protein [Lachnospiraceae bacterium]|jgi:DUF4097 and DUF4098 domain-containing protein YvlB|nr:DUF4097 domain-containing protein [Lachnospiraceae bacterium]